MNIPIFVINLDRSEDRMKAVGDRLAALGLTYERFAGFDGGQLQEHFVAEHYPQFLPSVRAGGALGGIGCSISHIEVCKLILARGLDKACIVEDDAEFDQDFPIFVDEATRYPAFAEAIKFEAAMKRKFVMCSHVTRVAGRNLVSVPGNNTNGSACYLITKAGAGKAVRLLAKTDFAGIDHLLFTYGSSTIKSLHVLPYPARQCGAPSTVAVSPPSQQPSAAPPKRRRRTMREVIEIRSRRAKEVSHSLWMSRHVAGWKMLNLKMARVQTPVMPSHS